MKNIQLGPVFVFVCAAFALVVTACGDDDASTGGFDAGGSGSGAAASGGGSGGGAGGSDAGGSGSGGAGSGGGSGRGADAPDAGGSDAGNAGGSDAGDAGSDPDEPFSRSSVELDGETAYIALGSFADIVANDAMPLTISVWTKLRGEVLSGAGIVNMKPTGSFGQSIDLFWSTELEDPSVALYMPGGNIRGVIDDPNAWNHIVAVYDPDATEGSGRLYVNGMLAGTIDTASTDLEVEGASEAGRYSTTLYLDGFIDDLALWNAALSDDAVASIYNQGRPSDLTVAQGAYAAAADLSAYWRMGEDDDAEGTTVTDIAAGNDATLQGGAVFSDDVP